MMVDWRLVAESLGPLFVALAPMLFFVLTA